MKFDLEFDRQETIAKLTNLLTLAENVGPDGEGDKFRGWHKLVHNFLKEAFTENAVADYFRKEADMQIYYSVEDQTEDVYGYDIARARKALRLFLRELSGVGETVAAFPSPAAKVTNRVFIVHGHDEKRLLEVKEVLKSQNLQPVVLKDEPNGGATVIEKFEKHADVGFAVILITADDLGKAKSDTGEPRPRARQNVILELGYFIGKLTRARVCALNDTGIEVPSDIHGVVYTALDGGGAWRYKLVDELKLAGYQTDKNKL